MDDPKVKRHDDDAHRQAAADAMPATSRTSATGSAALLVFLALGLGILIRHRPTR